MSEYFLGVDGGQSSTIAVICDEAGRIVGWATAGPCNHVSAAASRAKFLHVMRDCVSQAASRAGMPPRFPHFRAACLGMSGGPDDKTALLAEIFTADHILVTHDAKIAWAGAMECEPGLIVIAGTGSIAYGENAAGEAARAGGWGYVFGDEGGAFDIARQAMRAALKEYEGWGPRTALTPALAELTGTANANGALHLLYTPDWPRSRIAEFARAVDRIAEEGDPVAGDILRNAAHHLAMLAASVRGQLWTENGSKNDSENAAIRMSWIGGVFESRILLERFRTLVTLDGFTIAEPPRRSPAAGALILACRTAEVPLLPDTLSEIKH